MLATAQSTTTGAVPTGTVDFFDTSSTTPTTPIGYTILGAADGSSIGTLPTSALSLGSHTIVAIYFGDANFPAASSAALAEKVSKTPAVFSAAYKMAATPTELVHCPQHRKPGL